MHGEGEKGTGREAEAQAPETYSFTEEAGGIGQDTASP